jgi:hypothetical protein
MADLEGFHNALERNVGQTLHAIDWQVPTLVGTLLRMDAYYGQKNLRVRPVGVNGGSMRVHFTHGIPRWTGSNPNVEDIESHRMPPKRTPQHRVLRFKASGHRVYEQIHKKHIKDLAENDIPNIVQEHTKTIVRGYALTVQSELFPDTPSVGGVGSNGSETTLMQFDYPLQNGRANNDPAGALQPYSYGEIDLGQYPDAQAINVGTAATAWTLSEESIFEDILMKLRSRGAIVDMIICDIQAYSYLATVLKGRLRTTVENWNDMKNIMVTVDGIFVMYESELDKYIGTNRRQMYFGDSSVLRFGMDETAGNAIERLDRIPGYPDMIGFQGYVVSAFFNEMPRFWARAYNVTHP